MRLLTFLLALILISGCESPTNKGNETQPGLPLPWFLKITDLKFSKYPAVGDTFEVTVSFEFFKEADIRWRDSVFRAHYDSAFAKNNNRLHVCGGFMFYPYKKKEKFGYGAGVGRCNFAGVYTDAIKYVDGDISFDSWLGRLESGTLKARFVAVKEDTTTFQPLFWVKDSTKFYGAGFHYVDFVVQKDTGYTIYNTYEINRR